MSIEYLFSTDLRDIDWQQLKSTLSQDNFDNGRTAEQLRTSFENSYAAVIAYAGDQVVGTARVLSDGVCNAYLVDVWTYSPYRLRGIARSMITLLESRLEGQHIYLQTDHAQAFYEKLGYRGQPSGMSKVVGAWLKNQPG